MNLTREFDKTLFTGAGTASPFVLVICGFIGTASDRYTPPSLYISLTSVISSRKSSTSATLISAPPSARSAFHTAIGVAPPSHAR
jgi:hypothetical protein